MQMIVIKMLHKTTNKMSSQSVMRCGIVSYFYFLIPLTNRCDVVYLSTIFDWAVSLEVIELNKLHVNALIHDPIELLTVFGGVCKTDEIKIYLKLDIEIILNRYRSLNSQTL